MASVQDKDAVPPLQQICERARRRESYWCGPRFVALKELVPWSEDRLAQTAVTTPYLVNPAINAKVALWNGDSCVLELDAIVNAANNSLLGGGGIDGAIHRAAGRQLFEECRKLRGCATGESKITGGYRLPASHVIHTVGPVGEDPVALESCYQTILALVEKHQLRSVGFCGISTGIYGYPVHRAANVALRTVREWMERPGNCERVELFVFVVFRQSEERVYERLMPLYFPVVKEVKSLQDS